MAGKYVAVGGVFADQTIEAAASAMDDIQFGINTSVLEEGKVDFCFTPDITVIRVDAALGSDKL